MKRFSASIAFFKHSIWSFCFSHGMMPYKDQQDLPGAVGMQLVENTSSAERLGRQ